MGLTFRLGQVPLAIFTDTSNNVGIGAAANASFKLQVTGTTNVTGVLTLGSTISNGTFTYTLPSATGTLALTSALSGYLPLTGGTLTGALSGTSATFSSITANGLIYGRANASFPASGLGYYALKTNNFDGERGGLTIQVSSSTNTLTDALSINYLGNVGIGTSTPSARLDVRVAGESPATGAVALIAGTSNGINDVFRWFDGATQLGVFKNSGNVGIGTSSPAVNLDIAAANQILDSNGNFRILTTDSAAINKGGQFTMGGFYSGTSLSTVFGAISARKENGTDGNFLGYMAFATQNGSLQERMRITSGGFLKQKANGGSYFGGSYSEISNFNNVSGDNNLVLGLGSNAANTFSTFLICANTASDRLYILGNGNVVNTNGSYGTLSSDKRLKENVVSATPKLDDIMKLNVVNFNLIGNENKHIGFIAQEMQEVFPSFVYENDTRKYDEEGNVISGLEDALGLKVGMEFAVLVKAIQELKAEIDELKNK